MTELETRGIALIVGVRRGGSAREESIRRLREATNDKGEPALSWWMDTMIDQYSHGALPKDELEAAAERGFVKALETYVYRPGSRFVQTLSIHVKRCIESEIVSQVRKATTKASLATKLSVEDLREDPSYSSSIEDTDATLQLSLLSEALDEEQFFILQRILNPKKGEKLEEAQVEAIRQVAKQFFGDSVL